jgi:hypothetical protein
VFGMLDYRAHKLFWLLMLPFRLLAKLMFFVFIGLAIAIAEWTKFGVPIKMVVGYAAFEGMGIIFLPLWVGLVLLPIKTVFFWLIDVIPARGEDEEEAREVVENGRVFWLSKKLSNDIQNWTYKDTRDFVSAMNWRARLLFNAREQFDKRIAILQQVYEETGRQPGSFTQAEIKKMMGSLNAGWFETAIVNQHFFNSIVGGSIIILAILYLNQ